MTDLLAVLVPLVPLLGLAAAAYLVLRAIGPAAQGLGAGAAGVGQGLANALAGGAAIVSAIGGGIADTLTGTLSGVARVLPGGGSLAKGLGAGGGSLAGGLGIGAGGIIGGTLSGLATWRAARPVRRGPGRLRSFARNVARDAAFAAGGWHAAQGGEPDGLRQWPVALDDVDDVRAALEEAGEGGRLVWSDALGGPVLIGTRAEMDALASWALAGWEFDEGIPMEHEPPLEGRAAWKEADDG